MSRDSRAGAPPRIALVGYGMSGRTIHAPLLAAAGSAPSIVVTANPQRIARVNAELPGAMVVADLAAALRASPDLIVIASPSGVHATQAMACLAAGVPVVVDKPLAVDGGSARAVVAAATRAQVPLTVFQNRRWDAENRTLARLLAQGALGEVYRFERRWERWRPVPKDRWRENAAPAEGGGILLDLQTHLVDTAVHLFGPVARVYAEIAARTTAAEDETFLALQHVNGVRSHLGATSVAAAPGPRSRVLGSRGAYVVTDFELETGVFEGFADVPGHCGWLVAGSQRSPVPAASGTVQDFYPAVFAALAGPDTQARLPVDPQDSVHGLDVIDAARQSAAGARVLEVR